jgi:hypothetical protein
MRDVVVTMVVLLAAGTSESAFDTRIAEYMALRHEVEQRVAGPRASGDRAEIYRASDALAEAIRAARPRAAPGDIFSAGIAADFRQMIETVAREHALNVHPPDARPSVNARFDWNLDAVMPPFLITALPPLPQELQYRLVGCDLVLVDIVAGLVIDILPAALPNAC